MPARGRKRGEDRAHRPATRKPEADFPDAEEDDAIEILEVVGIDENADGALERPGAPPNAPCAGEADRGRASTELAEAIAEKERYRDLLLRKQAEFDNFRKRAEREVDRLRNAASADLVQRLLPILDDLERALGTAEGQDGALRLGVSLIHQQLLDLLLKEGLAPIDALGSTFDPRLHEAVEVLDAEGFKKGIVLEEVRKGYTLNDRLLRPALVKVASGREPEEGGSGPDVGA